MIVTVEFGSPYEAQLGLALLSRLKHAETAPVGIENDRSLALFPDALASIKELLEYLTPQEWSALPWTLEQHIRIRAYVQIKAPLD